MKLFRRTFLAAGISATSLLGLRSALASPLGLLKSRGRLALVWSRSSEGTAFSDGVRRDFGGKLHELPINPWTPGEVSRARAFLANLKDVRLIGFVTDEGAAVLNELIRDCGGRELYSGQHLVAGRLPSVRHVSLASADAVATAGAAPPARDENRAVPPRTPWYETLSRVLTMVATDRLAPPEAATRIGAATHAPDSAPGSFQSFVVQL
jgi:hypothetical protein